MTAERWQRLEKVLQDALDKSGEDRTFFLDQACAGDAALRAEVESMLALDGQAAGLIEEAIQGSAALFDGEHLGFQEGERIGVYRVIREIGRGGMGTVYLAERDDEQFKKRVAVKLVTRGMDTVELLRRFVHERQILARLDHPYIAGLLDGGSTADGRPYLVMEYVEGKAITTWCADRQLGPRQRIELFLRVCAAVQSAHQNLVVHRDLKPGNILVGEDGSPKLLDFGIAKLLGSDDGPQFTIAAGGMHMLTPDYASPEQVRCGPITTASDIYSLGAILYELVAGVRPHRLNNYTVAEIERAVCSQDPEKPSTASRRPRTASQPNHVPLKAGDLDNIVLMAMQKEPARRYASVAEFADDLRNYLGGLPVRAREDTIAYRARKFVRRHRAGVAAAVLLVATLAGGVTVSTIEAARARRRFNEVRSIAHDVLYDIHDAIRDLPGSTKAREAVVKTALKYLDGLAREAGGDPGIQLELAEAYQRVGDVQGNAIERSLGRTDDALVSYRKAIRIADELAVGHPESTRANLIRLGMRERIGNVAATRNANGEALDLFREGTAIGEAILQRNPANREILRALSSLYITTARLDRDSANSLVSAQKGLEILERLGKDQPSDEALQVDLSDGYSMLGTALLRGNELDAALAELLNVVRIREGLVAANPNNARYKRQLMIAYSKVGDVLGPITPSLQDRPKALEYYRKMLSLAESLRASDSADQRGALDHAMALSKIATAMPPDREHEAALEALRQARSIFTTLANADPKDSRLQRNILLVEGYLALRQKMAGDTAGALRTYREIIHSGEGLLAGHSKDLILLRDLFDSYRETAKAAASELQRPAAFEYSRKLVDMAQAARTVDPANPTTQAWLPEACATAGAVRATLASARSAPAAQRIEDWTQARDWYQQSATSWEQIHPQRGWPNDRDAQLARAHAEAERCASAAAAIH